MPAGIVHAKLLSEKDIIRLRKSIAPRYVLTVRIMMPAMILVFLFTGLFSLYAANFLAERIESDLAGTFISGTAGDQPGGTIQAYIA